MKNTIMTALVVMVAVLGVFVYLGSVKNHDLEVQNQKLMNKQEVLMKENKKLEKEVKGNVFKDEDHYECTMRTRDGRIVTAHVEYDGVFHNNTHYEVEVGSHN